jgi:hypothetical protein
VPVSIQQLEAIGVRGLPRFDFELGGKSLVILGENGTGKSSIVDALEFLFTGRIQHLEGPRELSLSRHGPSVGTDPTSMKVLAKANPGPVEFWRTLDEPPRATGAIVQVLDAGKEGTFILRRSHLLDFIVAQPAQRYLAIAPLIGAQSLEEPELALKRIKDEQEGTVNARSGELATLEAQLRQYLELPGGATESDLLRAINALRAANRLGAVDRLGEGIDSLAQRPPQSTPGTRADTLQVIARARGLIPVASQVSEIRAKLSVLVRNTVKLLEKGNAAQLGLLDFLRQGHDLIHSSEDALCPLCQQLIERETVLGELESRIRQLMELSEEASVVRTGASESREGLRVFLQNLQSAADSIGEIASLESVNRALQGVLGPVRELEAMLTPPSGRVPLLAEEKASSLINGIDEGCRNAIGACDAFLATQEAQSLQSQLRLLQAVVIVQRLMAARDGALQAKGAFVIADHLYGHFTSAKRDVITQVYNSVQAKLSEFYTAIHTAAPHGDIHLRLDSSRRASSTLLISSFGRQDVDPRAYASEGHLDTLGLCIFLAFADRFLEGFPMIVLDDVLTTVDSPHRLKVAKLLLTEFSSRQLLITTHDRIWYEELENLARACGRESDFKFLEIVDWNLEDGPRLRGYRPRLERITALLSENELRPAANELRQYLEWVLRIICSTTNAPLPYSANGSYELGALFDACKNRLDGLIQDAPTRERFRIAFGDLAGTVFMANLLSHENAYADGIARPELEAFLAAVTALHKSFQCNGCQGLLRYSKDLHLLACNKPSCLNPTRLTTR